MTAVLRTTGTDLLGDAADALAGTIALVPLACDAPSPAATLVRRLHEQTVEALQRHAAES